MTFGTWQTQKTMYCERAGKQVRLEAQITLPSTWLPEQPARVTGHRCSAGVECNLSERPSCRWAGTTPGYSPLQVD